MNQQAKYDYSNMISRITTAPSYAEVKVIVEAEMMVAGDQQESITDKVQLAENVVKTINTLHPVNYGPEEWGNIKMARIHFNRLRSKMKMEKE